MGGNGAIARSGRPGRGVRGPGLLHRADEGEDRPADGGGEPGPRGRHARQVGVGPGCCSRCCSPSGMGGEKPGISGVSGARASASGAEG